MLAKLIKAVLSAVLLNKTARYALIAALLKFGKYIFRPSTISKIRSFSAGLGRAAAGSARSGLLSGLLRGGAELLLLKFAKKGGLSGAGFLSALAAIFLAMSRERAKDQGAAGRRDKEQVIDLDEYTILDDNH